MVWSPSLKQITVMKQGGDAFPNPAEWIENISLDGASASNFDVAAARTAMGVSATLPLFCILGGTGPFYAHCHKTATLPTTSTNDGTASQFAPNNIYLDGSVTTLSLIASAAAKVSLSLYRA